MVSASGLEGIMIAVASDFVENEVDRVDMVTQLGGRLRVKNKKRVNWVLTMGVDERKREGL
jgi:hypothetical protein